MSIENGVIVSYQLQILVDHDQIFLVDCEYEGSDDLTQMYDEEHDHSSSWRCPRFAGYLHGAMVRQGASGVDPSA